jgi:hypothetical protein
MVEKFEFPRTDQHTVIVGQNGSGKSQAGFWLLSRAPFDKMPFVMFDYKREQMFAKMRRRGIVTRLRPTSFVPRRPGLYLMQPKEADDDAVDDFLRRCHRRGKIGLYFDEGYMIPDGERSALHLILTQGRARQTPIIACIQRPVLVDHFFFTEAKHLCIFKMIDREDRRTLSRYCPIDIDATFPRYHSYWYDNSRDLSFALPPVPTQDAILNDLAQKSPPRHWLWG